MSTSLGSTSGAVLVPDTGANYIELLPTEILGSILQDVCQSYPLPATTVNDTRDIVAHSLSWISPRFMHVARSTPSLWMDFGIYPFAPLDTTTKERLSHQIAGAKQSRTSRINIYVFDRRVDGRNVPYEELSRRVGQAFAGLCSPTLLPKWTLFDASTCDSRRMRALLTRLSGLRFEGLDELRLRCLLTPGFLRADRYLGDATFPKLRLVEFKHLDHQGFPLRPDIPTSLTVAHTFSLAASGMSNVWSMLANAGSSLEALQLDITLTENDNAQRVVPDKIHCESSNLCVKRLVLDAACLEYLLVSGTFRAAVYLRVTKLRNADDCMTTLGLVSPHGTKRFLNGRTFAPDIQSLAFEMHSCIETAPQLWQKFFDRVSGIQSIAVTSRTSPGDSTSVSGRSTLVIDLAPGGIRLWPLLVRLEFRGRSKDIISRVLAGLVGLHAHTNAPQIQLSVDLETEVHMGTWHYDKLWSRMEKGFVYDVQTF